MRPAPNTLTQIDELPGEEIEFGIGDPRWVMRTQAELYSDVTTAVIREYSTNAWDANVMAGHTDPIEVTLPSVMDHFFTVTDTGVGMNRDIFKKIYTQFGVSDKRESNDTNGMLGYGSKSGVAYTNQFTVTTVRDGIRTEAAVMRRPDWSIVLKVVAQQKTDAPNGTTIKIPVHNIEEFNHKAKEFYKFWLPGRVNVNGKPVAHHVGKSITDNLYYSKDWNTSYVVMGNVPYRIANPMALFENTKMNYLNFVAYVDKYEPEDGGAPVEFTPSREDLKYTDRTKATLHAIIKDFEQQILDKAQKEIDSAANHADAFIAWCNWVDVLGANMFSDLEFDGDKLEKEFKISGQVYQPNASWNSVYRTNNWDVKANPTTMVVTEFDINVSAAVKRRTMKYAKAQGWTVNHVIYSSQAAHEINSVWIKKDQFVSWEDLKEATPPEPKARNTSYGTAWNSGRLKGSWDYAMHDGMVYEEPIPKDAKRVYWISLQRSKRFNETGILRLMGDKEAVVLIVPENRRAKLLRENPDITPFLDYARSKVVADATTLLSDDAKAALAIANGTVQWANNLDEDACDDPEIARIKSLIKNREALMKPYNDNLALASAVGMGYNDVKKHNIAVTNDHILKTYPLLGMQYSHRIHDHTYLYMNAVYAAKKEKK